MVIYNTFHAFAYQSETVRLFFFLSQNCLPGFPIQRCTQFHLHRCHIFAHCGFITHSTNSFVELVPCAAYLVALFLGLSFIFCRFSDKCLPKVLLARPSWDKLATMFQTQVHISTQSDPVMYKDVSLMGSLTATRWIFMCITLWEWVRPILHKP